MTTQEVMEKIGEAQQRAGEAHRDHYIAMQAFQVACARGDYVLAQREQDAALAAMTRYMDELQLVTRLNRQVT